MITRRRFLRASLGLCAAGAGVAAYTRFIEPHWIEVVRLDMPVPNLPLAWEGKSLVHLSDLHIGPVVDNAYMARALQRVADLDPDVIAVTGDFMTCEGDEQVAHTLDMMRHLPPARTATVAVLGNHDYGRGYRQSKPANELARGLEQQDIRVLRNEAESFGGLTLIGLDDLWSPMWAPDAVLADLKPDTAGVALCHNPDGVDQPGWGGFKGWVLAGHTHGGQCRAPLYGAPILPVRNKRYDAGHIDLHDGRHLYINRALGYSHPVRFGARPEITVFTLARA